MPDLEQKTLYAIGANTVRMMAGNESFDASRANLDKFALYLDINPDGSIKIRPYRDINVIQLSDDKRFSKQVFLLKKLSMQPNMLIFSFTINTNQDLIGLKLKKNFV